MPVVEGRFCTGIDEKRLPDDQPAHRTQRFSDKAHTREGHAIAAARRRLPMVEVDPQTPLIGADGPVSFMGYPVPWYSVPPDSVDRLIADRYFGILACYLRDGDQVFETYWTSGRGDEVMAPP